MYFFFSPPELSFLRQPQTTWREGSPAITNLTSGTTLPTSSLRLGFKPLPRHSTNSCPSAFNNACFCAASTTSNQTRPVTKRTTYRRLASNHQSLPRREKVSRPAFRMLASTTPYGHISRLLVYLVLCARHAQICFLAPSLFTSTSIWGSRDCGRTTKLYPALSE